MENKIYRNYDVKSMGQLYADHVQAMFTEELHSKHDVAAELAFRDMRIQSLERELKACHVENLRILNAFQRKNKDTSGWGGKPTEEGIYMVRGFTYDNPRKVSVIEVAKNIQGSLVCSINLFCEPRQRDNSIAIERIDKNIEWLCLAGLKNK